MSFFDQDAFSDWLNSTSSALPSDMDVHATQALFQPLDAPPTLNIPPLADDRLLLPDSAPPPLNTTPDMAFDPMVQLYYQNFHKSHPILIPRKALHGPVSHLIPPFVISVMRYIGAHYYPDQSFKEAFRQPAYSTLSDPGVRDGFRVQVLLLLAIVDHSHGHGESAYRLIQTAVRLALEIGMHRSCFARKHSHSHSVLEESWRRTFWELYVVDGLLAAMREQSPFKLYHERADVRLPCPEKVYNTGDNVKLTRQTLHDLQNNWTLGREEQQFSSFAYRINAVRNLGMVLELNRSLEADLETQIETIDAHLATSLMSLPSLQGDGYDSSSHDEMVFQAQMTLYLAMIYVHHPRSSMRFASFHAQTSCTRLRAAKECNTNTTALDLHSHKLLRAADLLSNLATLPSPIRYRSPLFTCALAMCAMVHTAAGLVVPDSMKKESLKARTQLSIGGLNALGKVWPFARMIRQQMLDLYQEVVNR